MDLANLPAPAYTLLDACTQSLAAACYLLVGVSIWLRAPRDIRTRVFLALAIATFVVLAIPLLSWRRGITDPLKLPQWPLALLLSSLGIGALLLFHFIQVFPRRRPWIRSSGLQMAVAYVLVPLVVIGLVAYAPRQGAELGLTYMAAALVFGFPLLVLIGIVLPVAAILSLLKTYRELGAGNLVRLKRPIKWILISQIAGGTLAIVFAPVLNVVAPYRPVQAVVTLTIWGLGLLTPVAVGLAVWRYDALSVSVE